MTQDLRKTPNLGVLDTGKYEGAFIYAVANGEVEKAQHYIENGVSPNIMFSMALPERVQYQTEEERRFEINRSAVYIGDKLYGPKSGYENVPPIVIAALESGSPEMVKMLLEHGATIPEEFTISYTGVLGKQVAVPFRSSIEDTVIKAVIDEHQAAERGRGKMASKYAAKENVNLVAR